MSEDSKDPFEDKLKQSLDKSLDDLSPNVLANLNEIRHRALNQDGKAQSKFQWTVWGPVGGFATAAIVAALAAVATFESVAEMSDQEHLVLAALRRALEEGGEVH